MAVEDIPQAAVGNIMISDSTSTPSDSLHTAPLGMGIPFERIQSNVSTESFQQSYGGDIPSGDSPFTHSPLTSIAQKKRRSSKTTMPSIVKRSVSTPNVRGQAVADASAMSLAEKRRNKLGYHRTSVACGHCRRRKIRCLIAADDHQNRCSNCIRLKKECNFFPVDQQPPVERRGRTESRGGAGASSGSSSPSPGLSQSRSTEQIDDFNNYSPATSVGPHEFAVPESIRHRNGSVSSLGKVSRLQSHSTARRQELAQMQTGANLPRNYEVPQSADGSSAWNSPFIDNSPASAHKSAYEDPSSTFWRLAESPMTPAFSTFSGNSSIAAHNTPDERSAYSVEGSRDEASWPLPARSMSFGNVEGLAQNYSAHYPFRNDYKPMVANGDGYTHPIVTNHPSTLATMSAPASAVVDGKSASSRYPPHPVSWTANYLGNNIGEMPAKSGQNFGGWFGESGHLAQVEEEALPHHFAEETAVYYPPAAPTQG